MKIKLFLSTAVLATAIFGFANIARASCLTENFDQKTTAEKIQCLTAVIADLTTQIAQLKASQATTPTTPTNWCHNFNTNLGYVNSGSAEVGFLHTALQKEGFSYSPDTANKYSNPTMLAVMYFQKKYGITPLLGYVGEKTRTKLNALYGCKTTCTPNWQCQWGTCTNGYQSQTAVDSNNCGTGVANIACTALARACDITQPSITVTSPISGQTFTPGQQINITWTASGVNNVMIELDKDNPSQGWHLTYSVPASSGFYSWTVPTTGYDLPTAGSDYRIKIWDTTNSSIIGTSNYFAITAQTTVNCALTDVYIEQVSGYVYSNMYIKAKNLPTGNNYKITGVSDSWNGTGFTVLTRNADGSTTLKGNQTFGSTSVSYIMARKPTIALTDLSNNLVCGPIGTVVPVACDPQIECTVPPQGCNYVGGTCSSCGQLVCPNTPSITVSSPNGGEQWAQGSTHNITWNSSNTNNLTLRIILTDDTTSSTEIVSYIASAVPFSVGYYSWTVPSNLAVGSKYKILIGTGTIIDSSDNFFSITAPVAGCPTINCLMDSCPGRHLPDANGCVNCSSPCPPACANNGQKVYINSNFGPTQCCGENTGIKPSAVLNGGVCVAPTDGSKGTCVDNWQQTCGNGVCGAGEDKCNCSADCSSAQPSAPTVSIKANGSAGSVVVTSYGLATITWTSTNATFCTASGDWSGTKSVSGSVIIERISSNKTYTIACTGMNGTATDTVNIITSTSASLPPSVDIKIDNSNSPPDILSSAQINLHWTSDNATTCTASGDWSGSLHNSGGEAKRDLTPGKTYTFNIACQGAYGGTATDSVSITVKNLSVSIKANGSDGSTIINYNTSANLTWTSTGTVSCAASAGWSGTKSLSGTESTGNLTSSKTYLITCTDSVGNTAFDSVLVNITATSKPGVNITANGSSGTIYASADSIVKLAWTSANVTSCTGYWDLKAKPVSGSESVNVGSVVGGYERKYDIQCTGPNGTAFNSVVVKLSVTVSPTAVIKADGVDAPILNVFRGIGTSYAITWTSTNANNCNITEDKLFYPFTSTKDRLLPISGSKSFPQIIGGMSIKYTLSCVGDRGSATDSIIVNGPNVPITSTTVTADIKANGSSSDIVLPRYVSSANINWTSVNATSCTASGGYWSGTKNTSGSETVENITHTKIYTITCTGPGGAAVDSILVSPWSATSFNNMENQIASIADALAKIIQDMQSLLK